MNKFVRDHMYCINEGNFFPYEMPNVFSGAEQPGIRADWNGLWASFSPYPGAPMVNVGCPENSLLVSNRIYEYCMKLKGYELLNDYD